MNTQSEQYALGLSVAGTGEGVHAVIAAVQVSGQALSLRQVRREWLELIEPLRKQLQQVLSGPAAGADLATLDRDLGRAMAQAGAQTIAHARLPRRKLTGAGVWGLGVAPTTTPGAPGRAAEIRFGSPAETAAKTGLPVVADFARSDQAAGGRGGPLAAWVNYQLLHDPRKARVVLDLGKVATLTFLPAGGDVGDTVAYDLGPGTAVLDELSRRHHDRPYDADGGLAAQGRPRMEVVFDLLSAPYFNQPPPKRSFRADWQGMYLDWFDAVTTRAGLAGADLLATAAELTVELVARGVAGLTQRPHEVILCGGGARNIALAMRLRDRLSPASTVALERFDVDAASKDAFDAAALAAARLAEIPANIPQVTGADRAMLLGSVTRA